MERYNIVTSFGNSYRRSVNKGQSHKSHLDLLVIAISSTIFRFFALKHMFLWKTGSYQKNKHTIAKLITILKSDTEWGIWLINTPKNNLYFKIWIDAKIILCFIKKLLPFHSSYLNNYYIVPSVSHSRVLHILKNCLKVLKDLQINLNSLKWPIRAFELWHNMYFPTFIYNQPLPTHLLLKRFYTQMTTLWISSVF